MSLKQKCSNSDKALNSPTLFCDDLILNLVAHVVGHQIIVVTPWKSMTQLYKQWQCILVSMAYIIRNLQF